jgi:hypothetical protein
MASDKIYSRLNQVWTPIFSYLFPWVVNLDYMFRLFMLQEVVLGFSSGVYICLAIGYELEGFRTLNGIGLGLTKFEVMSSGKKKLEYMPIPAGKQRNLWLSKECADLANDSTFIARFSGT